MKKKRDLIVNILLLNEYSEELFYNLKINTWNYNTFIINICL